MAKTKKVVMLSVTTFLLRRAAPWAVWRRMKAPLLEPRAACNLWFHSLMTRIGTVWQRAALPDNIRQRAATAAICSYRCAAPNLARAHLATVARCAPAD